MRRIVGAIGLLLLPLGACSEDAPSEAGARDVCHQFVERRLKAPSTADYTSETVTEAAGVWTVSGNVDSENSFGGTVRNSFTCKASPTDDAGENWRLVDLQMTGN